MAWTDEKKNLVIESYKNTIEAEYDNDNDRYSANAEILAELAEEHGESVNGIRIILAKAGVYIKKPAAVKAAGKEGAAKRVNKAEAIQTLTNQISAIDPDLVDEEILGKLTGKAAQYFSSIVQALPQE